MPANEEVPPTVRVVMPVLLVIALALVITKLATIRLFCKSSTAAFSRVKLFVVKPSVPAPERMVWPALIVVVPL